MQGTHMIAVISTFCVNSVKYRGKHIVLHIRILVKQPAWGIGGTQLQAGSICPGPGYEVRRPRKPGKDVADHGVGGAGF